MAALNILQVAERVETLLAEAEDLQKNVDKGILITKENIVDATNSLTQVSCRCFLNQYNCLYFFNVKSPFKIYE